VFRLRGKGVPYIRGKGRGDQYVNIEVEIPKNLSAKQKNLLREFEADTEGKNYKKQRGFLDKMKEILKQED
jgi:molecular chaperone DnaJ